MIKKLLKIIAVSLIMFCAAICSAQDEPVTDLQKINMGLWQYDSDDDVYYQLGIVYCETPADTDYENLAIFVPGAFFKCSDNDDGTWTCKVNDDTAVGKFTAETAPIVIPVNTPGYTAMAPLSEYHSQNAFTNEGFIYVHAGCRGRDHGAPAGVTDLKAAIRYIRYNADLLPGNTESIFTFGMGGGGAQSAIIGATGDSEMYAPYLDAIGAVQNISDAILGSMCWCPITNLDHADEAYEWMMGITRTDLSDEEHAISDQLAAAYAAYVNMAEFRDPDGNPLTLEASTNGIYQSGSYYGYLSKVIERSLNNFLKDTIFPYDASSDFQDGTFGMTGNGGIRTEDMSDYQISDAADSAGKEGEDHSEETDGITRNPTSPGIILTGTYESVQDYIDALNINGEWVSYDPVSKTVSITNIADFVNIFKKSSKNLGAFDQLDGKQGENILFGYGDDAGAHFDPVLTETLNNLGSEYAESYAQDMVRTDAFGNTVDYRLNMYSPLYFLLETEEGYDSTKVAKYWRIRTGITQSDTPLTTEVNLVLALKNYDGTESVDFETIWAAGHIKAERTGDSDSNFIAWVKSIAGNQQ